MSTEISWRNIWSLAYPPIVGGLAQNIVSLMDTAFLGRYGEVELGASGLAGVWYYTFIVIAVSLGTGVQTIVARRVGQNEARAVGATVNQALLISIIFSLGLILFFLWGTPPILDLIIYSPEVHQATCTYLAWRTLDIPIMFAIYILRGFYNGVGENKIIIASTLGMAGINFVFNYALIFGHWGFPRMGIAGAALATSISLAGALLIMLGHLFYKHYPQNFGLQFKFSWNAKVNKEILSLCGPTIIQHLTSIASFFFMMACIEKMGERALAVSEVIKGLYIFLMVPTWGFTTAVGTLVSNLQGQNKTELVLPTIYKIIRFSFLASIGIASTLAFAPEWFLKIYTNEVAIIQLALPLTVILVISLLMYSITGVIISAVIGLGATRFALLAEIITIIIYAGYIYWAAIIVKADLKIIWLCEIVYMVVIGLIGWAYLQRGNWKKIRV
ncbi:MAG: MATE family efflux transporter [Bacteroidia bacterium]|nr:MATE family efflux transporter [Bacteroidia bacterium]MDW8157990.1 MATE family efflux transporter [Bacteroidia bacterium]